MEQTDENVPGTPNTEQAERLNVAAEIASAYSELPGRLIPISPELDGSAYPAAPPARQTAPEEAVTGACPRCGDVIHANDRFCRRCGQLLEQPVTQASLSPAYPAAAPGQYDRPGSYIDRRLRPGEQILFRTRLHWTQIIYALVGERQLRDRPANKNLQPAQPENKSNEIEEQDTIRVKIHDGLPGSSGGRRHGGG